MPSYTQYMRQMAVMDANDDDIESWITVKGNHIPIKKGQSKEDAVKEFISKKSDKEFSKRAEKPQSIGEATKKVVSQVKENREINKEAKKEYPAEFETVRKNAKANPYLYDLRYTQKSKSDAYKEYKADTEKKEETPADLEKRASAIGLKPGVKVQFADGTIKEVVGVRSDLVDLKKDGKVGAHTLYPLEKGIKNGEIKVLNGDKNKAPTEKKSYNDKGLYQDALNELDDQIADKEKELENIHLAMTQNAEAGYFDIANSNMMDIEFVEGQLKELKKKREKLAGTSEKKAPQNAKKSIYKLGQTLPNIGLVEKVDEEGRVFAGGSWYSRKQQSNLWNSPHPVGSDDPYKIAHRQKIDAVSRYNYHNAYRGGEIKTTELTEEERNEIKEKIQKLKKLAESGKK